MRPEIDPVALLSNNWWYNTTNPSGTGILTLTGVSKATGASDFWVTGSGTGGAVYTGTPPWDFSSATPDGQQHSRGLSDPDGFSTLK